MRIGVFGIGAVSPAGWGMEPLREAMRRGEPLPPTDLPRPGREQPLQVRSVPAAKPRPAFLRHPRMRRTSPIAQYLAAVALEALGEDHCSTAHPRLGLIFCVMAGCVNYSKRFYEETLQDPATASPLIFPETVFNAPTSHLATLLGSPAISYTLVGDPGVFLQGLALGADWLGDERVDGCLVLGAEEKHWLTSEALEMLNPGSILAEGAGAIYLRRGQPEQAVELERVTSPRLYLQQRRRTEAVQAMRGELPPGNAEELLCDSCQAIARQDRPELVAWQNWPGPRLSPKSILGEAFTATSAWQCVISADALMRKQHSAATISVVGCNQQAIGARFVRSDKD